MPQISVWRAKRSARIREERRNQAIELQKLKKCATRRCRNCLTPYRDQNPCGAKFMCGYCGHVSKRPVLDLPGWNDCAGGYWLHNGDVRCLAEKSYSGVLVFVVRLLGSCLFGVRFVFSKVFRLGLRDGDLIDGDGSGEHKIGENGSGLQESRVEKAKRKAEEKRQARLVREMLEEEERKQREEMAKLVEERRKLRDEKLEAEKPRTKVNLDSSLNGEAEREGKKEMEKKKKDRRREKDRERDRAWSYSSKSNSDGEEIERRASRECEKKKEFDKKSEIGRQRAMVESFKSQVLEAANNKAVGGKTRYFDRVRGNFFSNAKSLNGATSFFGRNTQPSVNVTKASKPNVGAVNNGQHSGTAKKDAQSPRNVIVKSTPSNPVMLPAPKKSWHQLFTRSSSVSPDPDANNIINGKLNATDQHALPCNYLDNELKFGTVVSNTAIIDSMFPPIKEPTHNTVVEDTDLFEDPCYVPDPKWHLEQFPLDLCTGFSEDSKVEVPRALKRVNASVEVSKPSPIESPLSRLRISEERQVSRTPKPKKKIMESEESGNLEGSGTWHMWGSPLAGDGIDLAGGPASWFPPLVQNKCIREDMLNPKLPSIVTPQKAFNPIGNDPWVQTSSPFQSPLQVDGGTQHLLDFIDTSPENELMYSTPKSSAAMDPFEVPPASNWSKEEWAAHGINENVNSNAPVEHLGLFSTGPDVQSVWSYNHK